MIRAIEIRQIAAAKAIKPEIIEKDYVLGWVITALNNQNIAYLRDKERISKLGSP